MDEKEKDIRQYLTNSVFIFASAGTGKTKVLVDRVVSLMFCGSAASSILCITFTSAAILEIKERIAKLLDKLLNDEVFAKQYSCDVLHVHYQKSVIDRFRSMRDEWSVSTANITTVHAFCQKLLMLYPIESGIKPDFIMMDNIDQNEFLLLAKDAFYAEHDVQSEHSLKILTRDVSLYSFDFLLNNIFKTQKIRRFFNLYSDHYEVYLSQKLHMEPEKKIAEQYSHISSDMFFTKTGTVKKNIKIHGLTEDEINVLTGIFVHNRNVQNKQKILNKTCKFLTLAKQIFNHYQILKQQHNMIDYTDAIYYTEHLLKNNEAILAQISYPISHILIDEAQDMNADQWRIIRYIAEEVLFNNSDSTIFVVGDTKQSIYAFQDADPALFLEFKDFCENLLKQCGKKVIIKYMNKSYRCLPEILNITDIVLHSRLQNYQQHISHRTGKGIVQLIDKQNVVEFIKQRLQSGDVVPADIMILTRARSNEVDIMYNELIANNIPVTGDNRIVLNKTMLIADIISVAEFALDSSNDYALACLLKSKNIYESPMSEKEIFDLCYNRTQSLSNIVEIEKLLNLDIEQRIFDFFEYVIDKILVVPQSQLIDEFMQIVLKCDERNMKLDEFLQWFTEHEIYTNIAYQDSNSIKISTIHGAKGLEARIVFLFDFCLDINEKYITFLWEESIDEITFCIKPKVIERFAEVSAMLDNTIRNEKNELLRMLYVAMTRAKDELYIIGPSTENGAFMMIKNALEIANSSK